MRRTRGTYLIRASLGEALAKGRQKERETALWISVAMGAHPWGVQPTLEPSLLCPSLLHHSHGAELLARGGQSHPTTAPSWRTFPLFGKPGTLQALYPLYFPPSWTHCKWAAPLASCCVLSLLNSHCFLHWDGLKYSSTSQRPLGIVPGQRVTAGDLLGVLRGQGSWHESTWDTSLLSSTTGMPLFPPELHGQLQQHREAGKCACSP